MDNLWLRLRRINKCYPFIKNIVSVPSIAVSELIRGIYELTGVTPELSDTPAHNEYIEFLISQKFDEETYQLVYFENIISISSGGLRGHLYGVFHLLRIMAMEDDCQDLLYVESPSCPIRIVSHTDKTDGTNGLAFLGSSVLCGTSEQLKEYCRLLVAVGINGIAIDSGFIGNVHIFDIFDAYNISVYLKADLSQYDDIQPAAKQWGKLVDMAFTKVPGFSGLLVSANKSETIVSDANMLADILAKYSAVLILNTDVYNDDFDWREVKKDRARVAFDEFAQHDGVFLANVILLIKNGSMSYQLREATSPLFDFLTMTKAALDVQIAAEFAGQQIDFVFLAPLWKAHLDKISPSAIVGVSNVGISGDMIWTGNPLSMSNLYAFGRLAWSENISITAIAVEFIKLFLSSEQKAVSILTDIFLKSAKVFEQYTAPLGLGWMVDCDHYTPNVDGFEYKNKGGYHRADRKFIGTDRSSTGTGLAGLYSSDNYFNSPEECPTELLLFFHRMNYEYKLKNGKTVIQHIYDSHFEGVERVKEFITKWDELKEYIEPNVFHSISGYFERQLKHAADWRDVVNTYFFRKTGIPDETWGRK